MNLPPIRDDESLVVGSVRSTHAPVPFAVVHAHHGRAVASTRRSTDNADRLDDGALSRPLARIRLRRRRNSALPPASPALGGNCGAPGGDGAETPRRRLYQRRVARRCRARCVCRRAAYEFARIPERSAQFRALCVAGVAAGGGAASEAAGAAHRLDARVGCRAGSAAAAGGRCDRRRPPRRTRQRARRRRRHEPPEYAAHAVQAPRRNICVARRRRRTTSCCASVPTSSCSRR